MVDVTGGNLYSLWKIAHVKLPRVAGVYNDASQKLAGTSSASSAFGTGGSDNMGRPTSSPILPEFEKLRDEYQHMLADCATNLYDAAAAVDKALESFKDQDTAAANDLEDKWLAGKEVDGVIRHDPNDSESNPPVDENNDNRADDPSKKPAQPYGNDDYESDGDKGIKDYDGNGKIDDADLQAHADYLKKISKEAEGMK